MRGVADALTKQTKLSVSYSLKKTEAVLMNQTLRKSNHKVCLRLCKLEWTTKCRYNAFRQLKYKNLVEACIGKAAHRHNMRIMPIGVMPGHVHTIVELPKGMKDEKAMQIMKGASSYCFFRNAEKFGLRYPQGHLWARSGAIISTGYSDLESSVDYAERQKEHRNVAFA